MTALQLRSVIYEVFMRRSAVNALAPFRATPPKCGDSSRTWDTNYEALCWLIEEEVLARLEAIFEGIKALETRDRGLAPDQDRAVRLPEVLRILGISKSSFYDRLNPKSPSHDPDLPRPFKLGNSERSPSVWWYSSMVAYLTSRAQLHATKD